MDLQHFVIALKLHMWDALINGFELLRFPEIVHK